LMIVSPSFNDEGVYHMKVSMNLLGKKQLT